MIKRLAIFALAVLSCHLTVLGIRADVPNYATFTNRLGWYTSTDSELTWNFSVQDRAQAMEAYWNIYLPLTQIPMGWTGNFATFTPGTTSQAWRNAELKYLNLERYRIFGQYCFAVTEVPAGQDRTDPTQPFYIANGNEAASMVFSLNNAISHTIDSSWIGYTPLAEQGAGSLAAQGATGLQGIIGFINDFGANNNAVGHRTSLLNAANTVGAFGDAPYTFQPGISGGGYMSGSAVNRQTSAQHATFTAWGATLTAQGNHNYNPMLWPAPGYIANAWMGLGGVNGGQYRLSITPQINYDSNGYLFTWDTSAMTATISCNGQPVQIDQFYVTPDVGTFVVTAELGSFKNMAQDRTFTVTYSGLVLKLYNSSDILTFTRIPQAAYSYSFTVFDPNKVTSTGLATKSSLANLSTRGLSGKGDSVMIAGFVIGGTEPMKVVIRGQGPGLAQYGVTNLMQDPNITLYDASGNTIGTNDNWQQGPNFRMVQAYNLNPSNILEPAAVAMLNPGAYTVVFGDNGTGGNGIIELFNVEGQTASQFVNISTRGYPGSTDADSMQAGFILQASTNLLIKARGPGLQKYGVSGTLPDTIIELKSIGDGPAVDLGSNSGWQTSPQASRFLPGGDLAGYVPDAAGDSVMVVTLPAGAYTALVRGVSGSGVGLVEVYKLP